MTFKEAQSLLSTPKKVVTDKGVLKDTFLLEQRNPLSVSLNLTDTETEKLKFRMTVKQSSKHGYKINFHLMDPNGYIGLTRLDINGSHRNPQQITSNVPDFLKKHVAELILTSHLHYYVENYKNLTWAVPLTDVDNDNIRDISTTTSHLLPDIANTLKGFLNYVHVTTKINIEQALL